MVINASANPRDKALRSSASFKKRKGSTAIDVRGVGLSTRLRAIPGSRTAAEGLENRIGRLVSLRGTLPEQLPHNGGQFRAHQRSGMNRRRVIVKDRVERIDR